MSSTSTQSQLCTATPIFRKVNSFRQITMKLPYVITYMYQNFCVRGVHGQIPRSIYQALWLLPSDFPNHFSKLVLI